MHTRNLSMVVPHFSRFFIKTDNSFLLLMQKRNNFSIIVLFLKFKIVWNSKLKTILVLRYKFDSQYILVWFN